jgi:L,D-peptidoglycan transpeptidase YkuD (ErfK/YbiS/YcfS/YnhG family)
MTKHDKLRRGCRKITHLRVVTLRGSCPRGRLVGSGLDLPCAIGRTGITRMKREGDGASPAGRLRILRGFYRPDRFATRPKSGVDLAAMRPSDGWSDDPRDPAYNRLIRRPYPRSHEAMWRGDGLYDLVLVLDWNIAPRVRGRGSAIFLHLAQADFAGTAGCVAVRRRDLLRLLERLSSRAVVRIG